MWIDALSRDKIGLYYLPPESWPTPKKLLAALPQFSFSKKESQAPWKRSELTA